MIYSLIGIVCVTLIGFIAHRVGICLVRAVKLLIEGQANLLLAILMSGLWVGAYSVLAHVNEWGQPFARFEFHPLFALGGFLFGVGASVNQGCSVSTMHQFARGNVSMLFTMAGWFFGWCLWVWLAMTELPEIQYPQSPPLDAGLVFIMFGLSVAFTLLMIILFPGERERWLGISLIGMLVGVLLYIEPMWAPSSVIQDVGSAIFEGKAVPSGYRMSLVMMLLIGMWISCLVVKNLRFRKPTLHKVVRHSIAGLMMGFGGAMALGGNDAQVLTGLPALSLGAMTAVIFMLIGIATEQFLYHRGSLFYQKR
ncbi:MAG: YeeE/YedE thiosulfate transporter family protein [Pseudomonadota bacterium]